MTPLSNLTSRDEILERINGTNAVRNSTFQSRAGGLIHPLQVRPLENPINVERMTRFHPRDGRAVHFAEEREQAQFPGLAEPSEPFRYNRREFENMMVMSCHRRERMNNIIMALLLVLIFLLLRK